MFELFLLLVCSAGPAQAAEVQPTIWHKAEARGFQCIDTSFRHDARQILQAFQTAGVVGSTTRATPGRSQAEVWALRASECPNVPEILLVAAAYALVKPVDLPKNIKGDTSIDEEMSIHQQTRKRALAWIDTALAESRAMGRPEPAPASYLQGLAHLSLGEIDLAREAFEAADKKAEMLPWWIEGAVALCDLLAGDLEGAMAKAHRMARHRLESRYTMYTHRPETAFVGFVHAMVLDRVGVTDLALFELKTVRGKQDGNLYRGTMEAMLPVHERIYFLALYHWAAGQAAVAKDHWRAYLARPQPEEPERRLVERHLRDLEPWASPTGG